MDAIKPSPEAAEVAEREKAKEKLIKSLEKVISAIYAYEPTSREVARHLAGLEGRLITARRFIEIG